MGGSVGTPAPPPPKKTKQRAKSDISFGEVLSPTAYRRGQGKIIAKNRINEFFRLKDRQQNQ